MIADLDRVVRRSLQEIAPDVDVGGLDADADLRDAADIDSVDFLNFVVLLHEATGVDIPEADYARLDTLNRCESYLRAALDAPQAR